MHCCIHLFDYIMNESSTWQFTQHFNTTTKLHIHLYTDGEWLWTQLGKRFIHKSFPLSTFQLFPTLSSSPSAKDWSAVSLKSELGTGPIYRGLAAQSETFQDELSTIAETGQKRKMCRLFNIFNMQQKGHRCKESKRRQLFSETPCVSLHDGQ